MLKIRSKDREVAWTVAMALAPLFQRVVAELLRKASKRPDTLAVPMRMRSAIVEATFGMPSLAPLDTEARLAIAADQRSDTASVHNTSLSRM